MPVMDGVTATKKIIERWGDTRPRIIALTANVLVEDKKKCIDAGMDDFIGKPIIKDDLINALSKCKKLLKT